MDDLAAMCFREPERAAKLLREQYALLEGMIADLKFCQGALEAMGLPTCAPTPEIMEALKRTNNTSQEDGK